MIILQGNYFSGQRPVGVQASLNISAGLVSLIAGNVSESFEAHQVKVSPRTGKADRFLALPNGGQFICPDQPVLDSFPQESRSEGIVAWLEERYQVALAGVVVVALIILAAYFLGLPYAAARIAARIPAETEQALGKQALNWLDTQQWLTPTKLDRTTQKSILRDFKKLGKGLPFERYFLLEFRSSKAFRENAFALPGGTIVITDEMVKAAETQQEVLAVLAHEIGHVEQRHVIRSILQNSAVAALAAAVTSDAASLSVAVAGLPVLIARTKYSREFERSADDFAFKLLKQNRYSPAAFASIMERLARNHEQEFAFAYLSSHPVTAERVKHARDAAR